MNNMINQLNLIDICRILHPSVYFSSTHKLFSRTDQILGHETNHNKFKSTEIIDSVFSNHNWIKLEIIKKRILEKLTNMWILNNILLNNQWVKETERKIKTYPETN